MQFQAFSKGVRISPRKVRLIAKSLRSLSPQAALEYLALINKRGTGPLLKTLKSALANAKAANVTVETLIIKSIDVSEAPSFKRFHPSTRGRVHPYKKRGTHIKIVLEDKKGGENSGK